MAATYDVIVAGLGAMGTAACWHLARRGLSVLGLEQFGIPHALGSSHGGSRLYRTCYYEHPDYVPLVQRAVVLWRELEARSGNALLTQTGGLYAGPPDNELVVGSLATARAHGLAHETLDRQALADRFPQFHVPDDSIAMFEADAGFVRPELAVATMAQLALQEGADLRAYEPVTRWDAAGGVFVRTPRGEYSAARLVICGGPWNSRLLRGLGVELVVSRQVTGWVWPGDPAPYTPERFPVWAIGGPDGGFHYGVPFLPGVPGLKIATHARGPAVDPDTVVRQPVPEDEETFLSALRSYLPGARGPVVSMTVCIYTSSPDSHFILDRHPEAPGVVLAAGFSGHGFKFAPVIGEALADLAQHGRSDLPIGFLGLGRFRS